MLKLLWWLNRYLCSERLAKWLRVKTLAAVQRKLDDTISMSLKVERDPNDPTKVIVEIPACMVPDHLK